MTFLRLTIQVDIQDVNQNTALMYAVCEGNKVLVRLLLEHGANPDVACQFLHQTPLSAQAAGTHKENLEVHKTEQLCGEHAQYADTALMLSTSIDRTEIGFLLIDYNCKVIYWYQCFLYVY